MKLSDLAAKGVGQLRGADCEFSAVNTDTRKIKAGELFVALRGKNFDGHDYIAVAEQGGACAVVCETSVPTHLPCLTVKDTTRALGEIAALKRQEFRGMLVAITGSCGKTTVKGMLKAICDQAGNSLATQGNLNNHIGVPLTLLRLDKTFDYAIVEAGTSGKGEIAYLANLIASDIAVVTNVHSAHLAGFGTVDAIAEEKSDMYSAGTAAARAIVNLDNPYAAVMLRKAAQYGRKITGFSCNKNAVNEVLLAGCEDVVHAQNIAVDSFGRASFDLPLDAVSNRISLAVVGEHNVANALAAIACAVKMGISVAAMQKGLSHFEGEAGRMQIKKGPFGSVLVDDSYNANPGSMKAAIDFLAQHKKSLLICGDMGELGPDSLALHRDVGLYAKQKNLGLVFSVGVNSQHISAELGERGQHFSNQSELVACVKNKIDAETVVLVKGSRSAKMDAVVASLMLQEECV